MMLIKTVSPAVQEAQKREKRKEMEITADKLFPPQKELLEQGFLESGKNYLVNMATGGGKSYMAELAIQKVLSEGYRVVFITPLRALASQQGDYWEDRFGAESVGVFTGETVSSRARASAYEKCRLLVMTPERFDMILRTWRSHYSWITEVDLIVVDEFHLLGLGRRAQGLRARSPGSSGSIPLPGSSAFRQPCLTSRSFPDGFMRNTTLPPGGRFR